MTPMTPSPSPLRSPRFTSPGRALISYISLSQKQASKSNTNNSGNGPSIIDDDVDDMWLLVIGVTAMVRTVPREKDERHTPEQATNAL
mmetsp:Transcript_4834/g.8490  ORF Transcript_4834/g.8490 Transcript_4834/m.8490 type:complete len:88 (+) Transcript_4834:587-850(+)